MLSTRTRITASASPETVNAETISSTVGQRAPDVGRRGAVGAVDLDQRLDRLAERSPVDPGAVADDHAVALETVDAALDGGRREAHVGADVRERPLRAFLQQRNNLAVDAVQRATELHLSTDRVRVSCVEPITAKQFHDGRHHSDAQGRSESDGARARRRLAHRRATRSRSHDGGRTVQLSERAARAVSASKQLKDELIAKEIPIYGVTTGFGDSAHRQISPGKAARLQQNIMRFMGVGTGPIAPPEVARVTMLLRANCLSKGNSGVRVELIERVLDLLNNDVVPFIPERGSVGASGDLAPLSYVGRALAGDGVRRVRRRRRAKPRDVLAELGLEPFLLEAKEGLALTNGTSFMSAFACLAVGAAQRARRSRRPDDRDGLRGDARQPRPLQRVPVRRRQAPPGDGHERPPHPRAAGRLAAWPPTATSCSRAASTAPSSSSSTARCRTSTRSAARRTSSASLRDVLDWVERWLDGRDQLLRRQPAVQRGRRARRERRQLLRRPHRPGDGLAQGRARQPVRPDRPPARAGRRREVQPGPDRQPDPALRARAIPRRGCTTASRECRSARRR